MPSAYFAQVTRDLLAKFLLWLPQSRVVSRVSPAYGVSAWWGVKFWASPCIDLHNRLYNSLALPCECVMCNRKTVVAIVLSSWKFQRVDGQLIDGSGITSLNRDYTRWQHPAKFALPVLFCFCVWSVHFSLSAHRCRCNENLRTNLFLLVAQVPLFPRTPSTTGKYIAYLYVTKKLDAGMWRYHANGMDARRSQFDLGRVDAYI